MMTAQAWRNPADKKGVRLAMKKRGCQGDEKPEYGVGKGSRRLAAGWRASSHSTTAYPPACVEAAAGRLDDGVFIIEQPSVSAAPSRASVVSMGSSVITAQATTATVGEVTDRGAPARTPRGGYSRRPLMRAGRLRRGCLVQNNVRVFGPEALACRRSLPPDLRGVRWRRGK